MVKSRRIKLQLNGKAKVLNAFPMERLLDVLRRQALLTAAKEGCGEGECGACAVFIDGKLVNSCLIPVAQVENAKVQTLEGVSGSALKKLQIAFISKSAAQCGICTPGMLMASVDLLKRRKKPKLPEIQEALAGNLCRCTGYTKIFEAVREAGR